MLRKAGEAPRRGAWSEHDNWRAWIGALGLAAVVGCAYFVAARIGLAFLTKAEGVAVFWPASGLAAGALIVLGLRARLCVAAAVMVATVAADLLAGRDLPTSLVFGFCNGGEALLAAWLVERWSGAGFTFDSLRELRGFLAASAVAPAVAAVGASVAVPALGVEASALGVWRTWSVAHALGILTVAPLVVGLCHTARERVGRAETMEAAAALVVLAVTSAALYTAPPGSWLAQQVPPVVLFPLLLWIGARCPPVCAAAAAFIISATIVGAATYRLGPFAAVDFAVANVQVTMLAAALCALSLAAVFAERRRGEAALRDSRERLELALRGAKLGVWGVDLATGAIELDARDIEINGHDPARPPLTLAQVRKFVYPADLPRLDAAFLEARRTGRPCQAEYRVRARDNPAQVRWVAVEGSVVLDASGRPARLLGVTRDITERKLAEGQKDLLLAELDHRVKNALAVVAAVMSRTQEASGSLAEFVAALDGRIKSMATTHELLSMCKWQGLKLAELIGRELGPYATGHNVSVGGPEVVLSAEAGQALAMVIHELVTNAAKYGALSVDRGRVAVQWAHVGGSDPGGGLLLDWLETNGPPVAPGVRMGYGTSVIRDLIPYELGGSADLRLASDGVHCQLKIPAKWLSGGDRLPHPDGAGTPLAWAGSGTARTGSSDAGWPGCGQHET